MAKASDKKVLDFIKKVKTLKEEIAQAERPNWNTNCSFQPLGGKAGNLVDGWSINIHVCASVQHLVQMVAFLRRQEADYNEAAKELGVDSKPFEWDGYPVNEWIEDIKTRVNKLQIEKKKQQLKTLEDRLDKIVSPELRRELELEAIEKELEDL